MSVIVAVFAANPLTASATYPESSVSSPISEAFGTIIDAM